MLADGLPKVSKDGLDAQHRLAPRSQVSQRARNGRRRRGGLAAALDGGFAARQVGRQGSGCRSSAKGPYAGRAQTQDALRAAAVAAGLADRHGSDHGQGKHRAATQGLHRHRAVQAQGTASPINTRCSHRFADYSSRKEAPSGYGGKREAIIEELRFVPVPSASTRVEGVLSGQFDYADQLPVESVSPPRQGGFAAVVPIMTQSFGFPYLVFNTKEGGACLASAYAKPCRPPSAPAK